MNPADLANLFQGDTTTLILKLVLAVLALSAWIYFTVQKNKAAQEETKKDQTQDQSGNPGSAQDIANSGDPAADVIDDLHHRKP